MSRPRHREGQLEPLAPSLLERLRGVVGATALAALVGVAVAVALAVAVVVVVIVALTVLA